VKLFKWVILLAVVAIVVFPAGIALGQPPVVAFRTLPDTVERGETFNITLNFTAPADNFSAPALTDFAPNGWNVTVSGSWVHPSAAVTATGNQADFQWWSNPYPNGTNFTVLYKVTVACDADLINYTFDEENKAYLAYYIGNSSQLWGSVEGNNVTSVVRPAICSTSSIDFYAAVNGTNPGNKTLELWSSTPCMLNWSITEIDADWLEAYPTNGSCTDVPSPVNLSVNMSGLPPETGNYTANITIESPDANNSSSPRIVPVTLHVSLNGFLHGQVDFIGRGTPPDDRWIEPFTVRFFDEGSEVTWSPINVTTNNTGEFNNSDIVAGVYDVGIKNFTCLSELVTNVTINAGELTEVDFGTTREGDSDGNDAVTIVDFSLLAAAFGSTPASPNWSANCDFDRNGAVIITDFSLLASNFGQSGDLLGY